jgi:hypothetical protein
MFCPGCGTENPAQAVYCYKCGAALPQAAPAQAFAAAVPPLATPPSVAPGYLWGYIQGWGMVIGGPILFLLFLWVFFMPGADHDTRLGAVVLMIAFAVGAVNGVGLLRKKRFGLLMVYAWAGLHVLFALIGVLALIGAPGDRDVHIGVLVILMGLVFWMLCAAYYHRRRGIFA